MFIWCVKVVFLSLILENTRQKTLKISKFNYYLLNKKIQFCNKILIYCKRVLLEI